MFSFVAFAFLDKNCRISVFSKFKYNKLSWNHLFKVCITVFISFSNCKLSGFDIIRLVSSANKIGVYKFDIACGKSFRYKKKIRDNFTRTGYSNELT